jgi:hypothetical protein
MCSRDLTVEEIQNACQLFEDAHGDVDLRRVTKESLQRFGLQVTRLLVTVRIRRRYGVQLVGTLPPEVWPAVEAKLIELGLAEKLAEPNAKE